MVTDWRERRKRGKLPLVRVCPRCRLIYATKVQWCGQDNTPLVEQPNDPLVGTDLERYRILEALGFGGMGVVYRAKHRYIDREYAIKVLYGDFAGDPKFQERFRREGKSISQIRHPNVVVVEDFGTTATGPTFLVMEMVHGRTLEDVIKEEAPFSPVRAAQIIRQVVAGLGAAHALGFIHRDVKPSNIMLADEKGVELVKILDFGAVSLRSVPSDKRLTSVGHIIGTPTYMAPEQSQDPAVGPPADLYAAGVMLYEMLTGVPPFVGKGRAEVLIKHIMEEPPTAPPSRGLENIVGALLQKQPGARPQTAAELIKMIDALGLDLAIVSDRAKVPQASLPTAELSRSRLRLSPDEVATRVQTPSTDPSSHPTPADPRPVQISNDPTPVEQEAFPVLGSSDTGEWSDWDHPVYTDLSSDDVGATTSRAKLPVDEDEEGDAFDGDTALDPLAEMAFGLHTAPNEIPSMDIDTGNLTDPQMEQPVDTTDTIQPPSGDDPLFEPAKPAVGTGAADRDDGPTQVDMDLMASFERPPQRVATDDLATSDLAPPRDSDLALVAPPAPLIDGLVPDPIDTAKTVSDSELVSAADTNVILATVRDVPSTAPVVPPTIEMPVQRPPVQTVRLPSLEGPFEEGEESQSLKARVIPVEESLADGQATRAAARATVFLKWGILALALGVIAVAFLLLLTQTPS